MPLMLGALAAHLAHGEAGDRRAQALGRDLEDMGHRDGGQQIHHGVTAGQRAFEIHAQAAEARAGGA